MCQVTLYNLLVETHKICKENSGGNVSVFPIMAFPTGNFMITEAQFSVSHKIRLKRHPRNSKLFFLIQDVRELAVWFQSAQRHSSFFCMRTPMHSVTNIRAVTLLAAALQSRTGMPVLQRPILQTWKLTWCESATHINTHYVSPNSHQFGESPALEEGGTQKPHSMTASYPHRWPQLNTILQGGSRASSPSGQRPG